MVVAGSGLDDAVPEPDPRRALAGGGEEHLGRARVRVLLEEVVLDLPDVVDPESVGELDLLERVGDQLELAPLAPGPGQLMLVEDAELHVSLRWLRASGGSLRREYSAKRRLRCAAMPTIVDKEETVRLLALEFDALEQLCASLDDPQWELPSVLPGWSVRDVVSHVVGTEAMLLGEEVPTVDVSRFDHVKNPVAEVNERFIESMRPLPPDRDAVAAALGDHTAPGGALRR